MSGMFSDKKSQEKYDKWSKQDIYEAYLIEVEARTMLNETVKRMERQIASLKHDTANMV